MRTLLALVLLLVIASTALANEDERAALDRFFLAEEMKAEWFGPEFLNAVPLAQLQPIREQIVGSLGSYESVRLEGDQWFALYETGKVPVYVTLDGQGRFVGLRLMPPIQRAGSWDDLANALDREPGDHAILILQDEEDLLARDADTPMAIGSAFKLVILAALMEEIEAGKRDWSDTIELQEELRSLPSGFLQSWPVDSPVTLHTLATLMISVSDNTATDHLLVTLGRKRVEAADPSGRNRPFLGTADAFRLKDPRNAEALERYRAADEAGQRAILEELAGQPLPGAAIFLDGPIALDIEWFFTARELCALLAKVQELDLTTVNPGLAARGTFDRVAFKGGSEPGVLNFTTWVRTKDEREACVCVTQNQDEAFEQNTAASVAGGALDLLKN